MADLLIQDVTLHNLATPIQELGGTTDQISIATMQSTVEEANEEIITQTDLIEQLKIKLQASASNKVWNIVSVEGAEYGFKLDEEGYYTSQNSGVNSSAALCQLNFDVIEPYDLYLDCINYGESNYDFSVFSKINAPLGIDCNSEGQQAAEIRNHANVHDYIDTHQTSKTITYSKISGQGSITIKFRKDHSGHQEPDCLRFKVRVEPAAVEQATPAISLNTSTGLITATSTQAAGRVVEGTKSSTLQLNTKGGTTITPGSSETTAISANTYALGTIKVAGDSDLEASNIKSGVTIFNTTGTFTKVDDNAVTASDIRSNKIAYVNGEEIIGSLPAYGSYNMSYSSLTDDTAANAQIKVNGTRSGSSCIIGQGSTTTLNVPASNFGNATREQVLNNATFTSSSGLAITGNIATKTSSDVTVSSNTVTIPSGYYASQTNKSIATATQATPTISFDTSTGVITASATQSAGYVSSGTKTATDSSSVVLKTQSDITTSGSTMTIPAGYYASAINKDINPASIVNGFAIIPQVSGASYGFKLQSDGYYKSTNYQVNNSAAVARVLYNFSTDTVIKVQVILTCEATHDTGIISNFNQTLSTTNSKDSSYAATLTCATSGVAQTTTTVFPTTSGAGFFDIKYRKDSSVNSGDDCLKFIVYTGDSPEVPEGSTGSSGSNTPTKTESDVTVSGATVTIPAGYYADQVTKTVATATQATPSMSFNSTTGVVTATATQTAGYVSAGTKTNTYTLTKKTSSDVTVSGNTVTIPAGYYASSVTKTVSGSGSSGGGNYSSGDIVLGPTVSFQLKNIGSTSSYYSNVTFKRSSSISQSGSSFILSNSGTTTYAIDQTSTESDCDSMKGFYVQFDTPSGSMTTAPTEIYFIPTDAQIDITTSYNSTTVTVTGARQPFILD